VTRALLERLTGPPDLGLGPSPPVGWGRRLLIGLAVVFWLVVIVVGLIGLAGGRRGHPDRTASAPPASTAGLAPTARAPGPGLVWHAPSTAVAAGSPAQEQYDQAFSQGLGSLPGMEAAGTLAAPVPIVSGGWPQLAVEITPERWAAAFVAALLSVDYGRQSRDTLAGWLQAQEAPELLPGVPTSVADKVLYVSLLDPALFGGQPTPVASADQWAAAARVGVRQTVSDVMVQADAGWAQMTAAGWQPTDVRMTEEDVSGVLTLHQGGRVTPHRFELQVIVGSARWHDGYGTVAVSGWQEQ
jgi:hypothetical protein